MPEELTSSKKTMIEIEEFWRRSALDYGISHKASWADINCMNLEFENLVNYIKDGDKVLDVGCANGYTTLRIAAKRNISIKGIDYIEEMVANAKQRLLNVEKTLESEVTFEIGDALNIDDSDSKYDVVSFIRVLCNLHNNENIIKALKEACRVLKVGGLLLISEPTVHGLSKLNLLRTEWGLDEIDLPSQNRYLDEEVLKKSVYGRLQHIDTKNFASSYFVLTRVLKPLLSKASGKENNIVDPDLEWNKLSTLMPSFGDYSSQNFSCLRRPR